MELALLVYGISLLESLGGVIFGTLFISGIVAAGTGMFIASWFFDGDEYSWNIDKSTGKLKERVAQSRAWGVRAFKWACSIFVVMAIVLAILPSKKTAWVMVGAYATQKVAEDPRTQEVGGKVLKIINQKLDEYIEEGLKEIEDRAKKSKESKK